MLDNKPTKPENHIKPETICVIGHELRTQLNNNEVFIRFFTHRPDFINIEYSADVTNIISSNLFKNDSNDVSGDDTSKKILFILKDFSGDDFELLTRNKCSIIGITYFLQSIMQNKPLNMVPYKRPLHNMAMQDLVLCFTGINPLEDAVSTYSINCHVMGEPIGSIAKPAQSSCWRRNNLLISTLFLYSKQKLLSLTRWMGATSRDNITQNKTTHLVAGNVHGAKYRTAVELGIHIMSPNWVLYCYDRRFELDFDANSASIIQEYKQRPFHGLKLAFSHFDPDDVKEMCELTLSNDGLIVDSSDPTCTHIVVNALSGDEGIYDQLREIDQKSHVYIVYKEWFWASLEMVCRPNEKPYEVSGLNTLTRRASHAHRLSIGYQSFNNVLSPMLDYSRSPESHEVSRRASRRLSLMLSPKSHKDIPSITPRRRTCLEILQTERNYVQVLETIVQLFKIPLENPELGEPILDAAEIKVIFGKLMPIYEIHRKMLKDLERDIEFNWNESNCIGRIFSHHAFELFKAYPPFVNFFEDTKKTLIECDNKYPRFHAFLKKCQSKKECGRESLSEMLIRPVQRIPSISLLIKELIKKTPETEPDHELLKEALERVKKIMSEVNEAKRATEGQLAMLDIFTNIEDCPPYLLSAKRRLICKAEARLLVTDSDNCVIPLKSHKVVIFLFNDLLEICKLRSLKRSHSSSTRSYGTIRRNIQSSASRTTTKKQYRHLDDLRLEDLKRIYRRCQSSELSEAIIMQAIPSTKYQNFRTYPLLIDDREITKDQFLDHVEKCNNECAQEAGIQLLVIEENLLPSDEIDFRYSEVLAKSMAKSRLSRLSIRQTFSPSIHRERAV